MRLQWRILKVENAIASPAKYQEWWDRSIFVFLMTYVEIERRRRKSDLPRSILDPILIKAYNIVNRGWRKETRCYNQTFSPNEFSVLFMLNTSSLATLACWQRRSFSEVEHFVIEIFESKREVEKFTNYDAVQPSQTVKLSLKFSPIVFHRFAQRQEIKISQCL